MDNVAKLYLEAFKGLIYKDDCQVADVRVRRIVDKRERERAEVCIEEV